MERQEHPELTISPAMATSTDRTSAEACESGEIMPRATDEGSQKPETTYLGPGHLVLLMLALSLVVLMVTLDISVVATAIPKITDEFNTIADIGWYAATYSLSTAALQPLTGKAYTFFPLKWAYLTFVAVFEIGSLLSALARSSKMLIIGRAIQGMGGAGLLNGALTMIAIAADTAKRPILISLVMATGGMGQLIGPLIGGVFSEHVSWRWCFWINLPIGGVVFVGMLPIRFPMYQRQKTLWTFRHVVRNFDLLGFALFAPACVMLLLALQWGGVEYSWSSAAIIGLFCGSACAFASFFFWESCVGETAMMPLSLMRRRVIYSSLLTAFFQYGGMLVLTYYLPLWFQAIKGTTPTLSAVYTLPTFISQLIAAIVAGIITSQTGFLTPLAFVGGCAGVISAGLMTTFHVHTGAGAWISYQILAGVGRGLSMQQPIQAVQSVVTSDLVAVATAMVGWAQLLGVAVLLGFAQTTFINVLPQALGRYAPSVDVNEAIKSGATNIVETIKARGDGVVVAQVLMAYNEAVVRVFYLALGCALFGLITCLGIWNTKMETKRSKLKKEAAEEKA